MGCHGHLLLFLTLMWPGHYVGTAVQREGSPSEEDPLWPSCRLPWTWFTEKRSNFFLCIKEALPLHLSRHCSQRGWKSIRILVLEGMTAALHNPWLNYRCIRLVYNCICPVWVKIQCWWIWYESQGLFCTWLHINWGQTLDSSTLTLGILPFFCWIFKAFSEGPSIELVQCDQQRWETILS